MIQFGNDKIKEIYVGSDKIKEVYHGSDLVWSGKKPSYAILTDDTRIDFELDSTPMSNLEGTASSITLNGTSYPKTTIKEITFGNSYGNVTSIGTYFLYNCRNLTSLDLSAFSNVTSIGTYFLYNCRNLTSLDLSAFSNVTSIGNYFLRNCSNLTSLDLSAFNNVTSIGTYFLFSCSNLTQFKISAINVPQTSTFGFLESTTALTTILVPMHWVQAYKTTSPWSNHASKITGYSVWKKPSYAILTDDTRIDFELDSTPMSNLEGTASSITLNGTSYPKTTIKEITFGNSYGNVTSIGTYFLMNCSNLTSLDLSAFSNVASIGTSFLHNCSNLTSLDLSAFSNVTSIGGSFLRDCLNLTQFKIGAINVPQTTTYLFLEKTTALTTILVPMQSVQAYKTAGGWSNFASIITGY